MLLRCLLLVLSFLAAVTSSQADPPRRLLLLYQGPDGHPPKTHEYEQGMKLLQALLKPAGDHGLETVLVNADEPWRQGPELLAKAEGAVLFLSEGAKWLAQDEKRLAAFRALAKRGGGLACLHWAMGTRDPKYIDPWLELFGGCHGGPDRKYKVLATKARPDPKHPITLDQPPFEVRDEFYYHLKFFKGDPAPRPILTAAIDGREETVAWAWERKDGGRSFGFTGLHFHENWTMPEYRRLMRDGVLWTMKVAVEKK